jgi:hypothetical protein
MPGGRSLSNMAKRLEIPAETVRRLWAARAAGRVLVPLAGSRPHPDGGYHVTFCHLTGLGATLDGQSLLPIFSSRNQVAAGGFASVPLVTPSPADLVGVLGGSAAIAFDAGDDPVLTMTLSDFAQLWDRLDRPDDLINDD